MVWAYINERATGGAVASFPWGKALDGWCFLLVLFFCAERKGQVLKDVALINEIPRLRSGWQRGGTLRMTRRRDCLSDMEHNWTRTALLAIAKGIAPSKSSIPYLLPVWTQFPITSLMSGRYGGRSSLRFRGKHLQFGPDLVCLLPSIAPFQSRVGSVL